MLFNQIDPHGDTIWQKKFAKPGKHVVPSGGFAESDGVIMYGNIQDTGAADHKGFMAKFNRQAELLWFQEYDINNGSIGLIAEVIPTPDNGYSLIGSVEQNDVNTYFAKTDSQGNVLFDNIHTNHQLSHTKPLCIERTKQGNYLAGGWWSPAYSSAFNKPFLSKLDSTGQVIWERGLDTSSYEDGHGKIGYIVPTYDGNYLLMGFRDHPPDFVNQIPSKPYGWTRKIDSAGNTLWERDYIDKEADFGIFRYGRQLPDSSFVLIGGMGNAKQGRGNEGWMMKLSQDGDSLWSRTHFHPDSDTTLPQTWYHFTTTRDNGFILTGSGFDSGGNDQDIIVFKVDSAGCVWPGCKQPPKDTSDITFVAPPTAQYVNVTVSPNPFSQSTIIRLQMREQPRATPQLRVYDLQGRQVKTLSAQSSSPAKGQTTFRLQQEGLSTGMYFYRISIEGQPVASGKVVVQ